METDFCSLAKVSFNKAIENLEERLKSIRAGRANPNMLDNVMVSYYNQRNHLGDLSHQLLL